MIKCRKTTLMALTLSSVITFNSAYASNCKSAVNAFNRAKDAETQACNAASKAWKDKTLDEYKNADKRCKENRKKSERASKKMREVC